VGHCHPKIVQAGCDQLKKLMHSTTIYLHPEIGSFAKELAAKLPGDLKCVYFVNSGSEANDLALLMARLHTGNNDLIAMRNGYHGMSYTAMGLTALHTWKYPATQGQGIYHATNPDLYKGLWQKDDPKAIDKYHAELENLVKSSTSGKIAGYITETIQGVGGFVELPDGYLPKVYQTIEIMVEFVSLMKFNLDLDVLEPIIGDSKRKE